MLPLSGINFEKNDGKVSRKSNRKDVGTLRVIGGHHRGRKLEIFDAEGLRPTGDRMREVVFNWLTPYLPGAKVLDVFAGTGILGVEAISRGASHATFCEFQRPVFEVLKRNTTMLAPECFTLHQSDALKLLAELDVSAIDVVFLDPPFSEGLWQNALNELDPKLPAHGLIYLEAPKQQRIELPKGWSWLKHKSTGNVQFGILERD